MDTVWVRALEDALHDVSTVGLALAVMISWERHKEVLPAFVHGMLGWYYILYLWIKGEI